MDSQENKAKNGKMDWTPMILFYAKTTSWIVLPLVIAILLGKKVAPAYYFLFVIAGFGVTCYGIYKEIKAYKKQLDKEDTKNGK
ncbi:MAG: hypothetical protein WDN09_03180 [bacterium]